MTGRAGLGLMLGILALLAVGCVSDQGQQQEGSPEVGSVLDAELVPEKLGAAQQAFFYVSSGGSDLDYESFEYDGFYYRYMGESLGTLEELHQYLEPYYTREGIDLLVENAGFIEHDGRLAQPDADGGSLIDWSLGKAELIESDAGRATFTVSVDYADQTETTDFTFELDGGVWKLVYPYFL